MKSSEPNEFEKIIEFYKIGAIVELDCYVQLMKRITKENAADLWAAVPEDMRADLREDAFSEKPHKIYWLGSRKEDREKESQAYNDGLKILQEYLEQN